jgi:hypothetical protein
MSSFLSGRGAGPDEDPGGRDRVLEDLRHAYPLVAGCLGGITGPTPADSLPCSTIMVFLDGGKVKFCLSPSEGPQIAFGCVGDPVLLWESIEDALRAGDVEWKARSGKRRG